MRNKKILGLSALTLSIMAASNVSNAQTFEAAEIIQPILISANEKSIFQNVTRRTELAAENGDAQAKEDNADFSLWRDEQRFKSHDFTDRIIVKYKAGFEAQSLNGFTSEKALPNGLAKKAGHSLKHLKKLKNGRHVISLGKQKNINEVKGYEAWRQDEIKGYEAWRQG